MVSNEVGVALKFRVHHCSRAPAAPLLEILDPPLYMVDGFPQGVGGGGGECPHPHPPNETLHEYHNIVSFTIPNHSYIDARIYY